MKSLSLYPVLCVHYGHKVNQLMSENLSEHGFASPQVFLAGSEWILESQLRDRGSQDTVVPLGTVSDVCYNYQSPIFHPQNGRI